MWVCKHCETVNKEEDGLCWVCGSSREKASPVERKPISTGGSSILSTIKKCAGSNIAIASVIFYAAYIVLFIIGMIINATSAANMLGNVDFGLSNLSDNILYSIVNYAFSVVIVASLPMIIICVFAMIFSFYARNKKSEIKLYSLKAIKIVEIIEIVLYGLLIMILLIASIMFIPNVPSQAQGTLILLSLAFIGYFTLGLLYKVFLVISISSLIQTIDRNRKTGSISAFAGIMMYIYGVIYGILALVQIVMSPESVLSSGCLCTAYILFALGFLKLKNELSVIPNVGYAIPKPAEAYSTVMREPITERNASRRPANIEQPKPERPKSRLKGEMGRPKYMSGSVLKQGSQYSRSGSGFKKADDLD